MRTTFFAINFSMALLLMASSIAAIPGVETQVSGLCLLPVVTLYAGAGWLAWSRCRRDLERVLGVVCLGMGGLVLFAVVVGIWEAMWSQPPAGFAWALLLLSCAGVYLGVCGWFRWCAGAVKVASCDAV